MNTVKIDNVKDALCDVALKICLTILMPMKSSPIQLFRQVHTRAEDFLNLNQSGRKGEDDMRAALVFGVAALDLYFHLKTVRYYRLKEGNKKIVLPSDTQELIRNIYTLDNIGKDYKDLRPDQRRMINTACSSGERYLLRYVEKALESRSFQSIADISDAFRYMNQNPQEIWNRVEKRHTGARDRLTSLFDRRHRIVHLGDMNTKGSRAGKPTRIQSGYAKELLKASKDAVEVIEGVIK